MLFLDIIDRADDEGCNNLGAEQYSDTDTGVEKYIFCLFEFFRLPLCFDKFISCINKSKDGDDSPDLYHISHNRFYKTRNISDILQRIADDPSNRPNKLQKKLMEWKLLVWRQKR